MALPKVKTIKPLEIKGEDNGIKWMIQVHRYWTRWYIGASGKYLEVEPSDSFKKQVLENLKKRRFDYSIRRKLLVRKNALEVIHYDLGYNIAEAIKGVNEIINSK